MELPQSLPLGTTQARKATHDFLTLYSHSTLSQDPRPSHDLPKTHNFLQPLEGEQRNNVKENGAAEKNVKPLIADPPTSVVEHVLPGGIGTYSISCLPYICQKVPKPEENGLPVVSLSNSDISGSNYSSYTGGSFKLWHESTVKNGDTGKENSVCVNLGKEPRKVGQWPLNRPSQSPSNGNSSVSRPSSSQELGQKNHSFVEMLKSTKRPHSLKDDDEDLRIKKESNSCRIGESRIEVDGNSTTRSKHSATEQRRRCKINDRLQRLREIIPHVDQKKDKASFLQEVIEYIQFLQEKVNLYEGPHAGFSCEQAKLNPRSDSHGPRRSFVDQPRVANGVSNPVLTLNAKLEDAETKSDHSMINSLNFKTMDPHSELATKARPTSSPMQSGICAPFRGSCAVAEPPPTIPDEGEASVPQMRLWPSRPSEREPFAACAKLIDQELALEGGTINISSIYSQGLLNSLTCALQKSGIDLSQASISVQVDIGKRANKRQSTPDSMLTTVDAPCDNQSFRHGRVESGGNESDHRDKKRKTS